MKAVKLVMVLGLFFGFVSCTEDERQVVVPTEVADELMSVDSTNTTDDLEFDIEEEAEGEPTLGAGSSGRGH